ncbi:hypothetical protein FH972_023518 [Carpinus fangiana]|uniref:DUF1014 domain-containing protein n=1 Tax=Carpinus fangiana TaxID=176857 RepID=A0A5N6KVT0_9ROSI|nr:hypothetical protein FH972_023518 [Carpinus fangiana]
MAPKNKGENSKKAAGNAKKAEAAAQKQAVEDSKKAQADAQEWSKGAKSNAKKDQAEEKAAEAARKKAEKAAMLAEEEASMPSKPKNTKTAQKKNAGPSKGTLDLSQLDAPSGPKTSLNASGIDNALDALSLANSSGTNDKIDRHPERRFKAAYTQFEERRLDEMKDEKGLRRQQKIDQIRKEFEKHPDNPFNQALIGTYDMSKDEAAELRQKKREEIEGRLGS